MSASKARMADEINQLRKQRDQEYRLVIRLLRCLVQLQEDNPDLQLPDDLSGLEESYWRAL